MFFSFVGMYLLLSIQFLRFSLEQNNCKMHYDAQKEEIFEIGSINSRERKMESIFGKLEHNN